jgi:hypothetical protein
MSVQRAVFRERERAAAAAAAEAIQLHSGGLARVKSLAEQSSGDRLLLLSVVLFLELYLYIYISPLTFDPAFGACL